MKLISFTVPCYNSQAYMRKCIESILPGGDEVEIIVVNDGSKDDTLQIAREYEAKYPAVVRVIDKPNGGHGSGVNAGLKIATGLYYKVVDSDDWLDGAAYETVLSTVREHAKAGTLPDLYVTNFVYEHVADGTANVSGYEKKMPQGKFFGWEKVKAFRYSHMMLMHALLYKRERLIECGLQLPEHTFYVDEIYAYQPLPFVRDIFYINVDWYRYFIGRDDQSVNMKNFVKRYDQQIRVMQCMADAYSWEEIKKQPRGLKRYMWHSLNAIMITTLLFVCAADGNTRRAAHKELWQHIKKRDKALYRKLRYGSYATAVNFLPWKLRGALLRFGYKVLCKRVKLG